MNSEVIPKDIPRKGSCFNCGWRDYWDVGNLCRYDGHYFQDYLRVPDEMCRHWKMDKRKPEAIRFYTGRRRKYRMKIEHRFYKPTNSHWLIICGISYGIRWNAKGPVRKRLLLRVKHRYEYINYGVPWIGRWRQDAAD